MIEKHILIHLTSKWRPINYSFLCMLISTLCLINLYKKQKNFEVKMRRRGLYNNINTEVKEKFIGHHFEIRCIGSHRTFWSLLYFQTLILSVKVGHATVINCFIMWIIHIFVKMFGTMTPFFQWKTKTSATSSLQCYFIGQCSTLFVY